MLTIIGCGNSNRSDDGVGVWIARQLQAELGARPRPAVRVFDTGTGGMDVMFQARGARKLIIVDASRSGAEAGAIHTVPGSELAADRAPSYTLHDFRWDHALAAGRKIFRDTFPADVTVYLIEASSLEFGLELSPVVREAAGRVLAALRREIEGYAPPEVRIEAEAEVRNGNLYLSREVCEAHLAGAGSVALVQRDGQAMLVPLQPDAAGGLLLKVRNARGDCVIHAQEFFRQHGYLEDAEARQCSLAWSAQFAALVIGDLPRG